uniref:Putative secreted protein n=1 Tax=Anopheles darlingi TaxID=43151 RepID=A0A2M4D1C8_ANODA
MHLLCAQLVRVMIMRWSNAWMRRRWKTSDVLYVGSFNVIALKVLVQNGKDLRVQYLEASYAIDHSFQINSFYRIIFTINPLDAQYMITEIQCLKLALLVQQHNDGTPSPM